MKRLRSVFLLNKKQVKPQLNNDEQINAKVRQENFYVVEDTIS